MDKDIKILLSQKNYQKAFNLIVDNYNQRLYWHVRKMVIVHDDADDVLQNTYVKVWRALPNFRSESAIFTWLYRIATNESLTFLKKRNQSISYDNLAGEIAHNLETDEYFDGDDAQLKLQQAIFALPEKQKAVFNLRYFEEMSYKEMSRVLETSEGALKASYHHAIKKIEIFLKDD